MAYLLDTNSYFLFFQRPVPSSYSRLIQKLKTEAIVSFYISEITSMEIHSVLGKYRRGTQGQHQRCKRRILHNGEAMDCTNTWISPERKKMKRRVFLGFQKMISDIERKKGDIHAMILRLDQEAILQGRKLLKNYADQHRFGSHDALIAGSAIVARDTIGPDMKVVTSDKGLKAVLRAETFPYYDPQTG